MEPYKQLIKYCPIQNNWILQMNYQQIISHHNQVVRRVNLDNQCEPSELVEPFSLCHIFFNYMTDQQLIALVLTVANQLVLINNRIEIEQIEDNSASQDETDDSIEIIKPKTATPLPKIKDLSSQLTIITRYQHLVLPEVLSNSLQKAVGLKKWFKNLKILKNNSQLIDYASLFDSSDSDVKLLVKIEQFIQQSGSTLNLEHHYLIDDRLMAQIHSNKSVESVIFFQNCQFRDFSWLVKFPNLTRLEINQCQQIDQTLFAQICRSCPQLNSIKLIYCCNINIRILLDLLKLDRLMKIEIDYPNFYCQLSAKEVLISKDEWKSSCSFTLQSLAINSENMTLDVLDYILKSCPELRDIYLNHQILETVAKNIMFNQEDYDQTKLVNFHSTSDVRRGFKANRPISFKNMFKNYITAPFSNSMLEKIKQKERENQVIQNSIEELTRNGVKI